VAITVLAVCALRGETGSRACAVCHRDIYETYSATGMARSSGIVRTIDREGQFEHSGVTYRTYNERGSALFAFDTGGVRGKRPLEFFIGSGAVGRSFLYAHEGFLYEAPVTWYTARAIWDLAPGYEQYDHVYLTREVEPACLTCHASRLQPVAGTRNGYRSPPFLEGGISCERCHGPGEQHSRGNGQIVNPAKLSPERRDSICAQCHLSGEARITRAAASPFRPGDRLADSMVAFVWSGGNPDMKVTDHFERLSLSACKRASGDRLWCGTCHDVHKQPTESERAAFYRGKCLGCHEANQCDRGLDCLGCHMKKNPVRDVRHSVYTDHAIRKPGSAGGESSQARRLVPFGPTPAGPRELGLAYAKIPGFGVQAVQYLEKAPQDDAEVLLQLAYLYDSKGDEPRAVPLYEKALKLDGTLVAAAVNLAAARVHQGRMEDAIRLLNQALQCSPGLENPRLNLAVIQYRAGHIQEAQDSLQKLLELNPGVSLARKLLNDIRMGH
jgi:Tetratricopeptide repeat/Cytochrome c554 and c-prime